MRATLYCGDGMAVERPVRVNDSADRVLRLIEALGPQWQMVSLSVIAQRLGLSKSSVHRLLSVLLAQGLVDRDPFTHQYALGMKLFGLGSVAVRERGLHQVAEPALASLAAPTGDTSHLAMLSGVEAVSVYKVGGESSIIIMALRLGEKSPAYASSTRKVLTAWAGNDLLTEFVKRPMRAHTRNTITSVENFTRELAQVRRQAYAVDLEEFQEGVVCVAAPMRDRTGRVVAAASVAGPRARFGLSRIEEIIPLVVQTADGLSQYMRSAASPGAPGLTPAGLG